MTSRKPGRDTLAIHGPPQSEKRGDWEPLVPPLVQSATFTNPVGSTQEVLYGRYGNTPNQLRLAAKYAALEGAEAALFVSSGMAATALAHLAILRPGDHLLASEWIYGGTRALFDEEFGRLGIEVDYVDPTLARDWRRSLKKNTRALFLETPTNPLGRVIDLDPIAKLTREHGLALMVDATFASPMNFRPLEHGADTVITSATKYLNGHGDVIGGAVAGSSSLIEEIVRLMRRWGQALDPHAAWLIERGMRTLPVRMARHNHNALLVAEWAANQPVFSAVYYPGLPEHPDHDVARKSLDGFGGMVGLLLKGGAAAAEAMLENLGLIVHAPSLATIESLVSEPRLTSHAGMTEAQRASLGFPDGFVRLSVGLEDPQDIIGDLEQALKNAAGSGG